MIWSFSASRNFLRCQRQWYLKGKVASHAAKKDPVRREAYLLSKLDSLYSWRGKIVDDVISAAVVWPLSQGRRPNLGFVLQRAKRLYEARLAFARANRLREPGMTVSGAGEAFAALRDVDYGLPLEDNALLTAWEDIERALTNLLGMENLLRSLGHMQLFPQRPLLFRLDTLTEEPVPIRAVPDLIAFSSSEPPLIIDWKVHTFAQTDYRLQLALYALALKRCKPHKDFPATLAQYDFRDLRLLEVQLLKGAQRAYTLQDDDVAELEAYIAETATLMEMAHSADSFEELPMAFYPDTCSRCKFQRLCWEATTEVVNEGAQAEIFSTLTR